MSGFTLMPNSENLSKGKRKVGNYIGIKTICQLLINSGLITRQEYDKCMKELEKSWFVEKDEAINEMLDKASIIRWN